MNTDTLGFIFMVGVLVVGSIAVYRNWPTLLPKKSYSDSEMSKDAW